MRLRIEQATPLDDHQLKILGQLRAAPSPIRGGWTRGDWAWKFYITGIVVKPSGRIFLECWEATIRGISGYRYVEHITPHEHVLEGVDQ